jgi:acetyl-CoA C-acetyltransferase
MSKTVHIVAAGRTPIGAFNGTLSKTPAHQLGATVINGIIEKIKLPKEMIDDVIMGQVLSAGMGQNPARQAAMAAGIPESVPAMTIDQVCGSGLRAIHLAAQAIQCGDAEIVIAGGQENMSMSPHLLLKSRTGVKLGNWEMLDSTVHDGLWDVFNDYHMGITAENLAEKYGISREEQDEFAANSQQKTEQAISENKFQEEIIAVEIQQRKKDPLIFNKDEYPKEGVTTESLASLRPAFKSDGTVTPANASGINDGAAAVIVMSDEKLNELGLESMASIKSYACAGVDPAIMGIGPVPATQKCLDKAGWSLEDLDLIESNEAFAVQSLSVQKELQWNSEIVNVNGGSIALGHPIGVSGCRIVVTLLHEMRRRDAKKGLATLCVGGGQGLAMTVER